jgi:hypothetical protein
MWKHISSWKGIWIREPAFRIDNGRKHSKSKSATFDQRFLAITLAKLWKVINLFYNGIILHIFSRKVVYEFTVIDDYISHFHAMNWTDLYSSY